MASDNGKYASKFWWKQNKKKANQNTNRLKNSKKNHHCVPTWTQWCTYVCNPDMQQKITWAPCTPHRVWMGRRESLGSGGEQGNQELQWVHQCIYVYCITTCLSYTSIGVCAYIMYVRMYVYMYTHIHMHTHMPWLCIHIYTHTHTRICIHTLTYVYTHTINKHMCTLIRTHRYMYTKIHAHNPSSIYDPQGDPGEKGNVGPSGSPGARGVPGKQVSIINNHLYTQHYITQKTRCIPLSTIRTPSPPPPPSSV